MDSQSLKDSWCKELDRLGISHAKKAAVFFPAPMGKWCWYAAVEKTRGYKSIVLRWCSKMSPPPKLPEVMEGDIVIDEPPRSDREKGWDYRVSLRPDQLEGFLQQLPREKA